MKTSSLSSDEDINAYQTHFAKKELKELGIWDSPEWMIEEVTADDD